MTEQQTQQAETTVLPTPYHKIDPDKAIELRLKGLTYRDIGEYFGCSHSAVVQRISGMLPDEIDIRMYKQHRADILAGKQAEILTYLTKEKLEKSTGQALVWMYGVLTDKERIERGQATQIIEERKVDAVGLLKALEGL